MSRGREHRRNKPYRQRNPYGKHISHAEPYRVLVQRGSEVLTWDFKEYWHAEVAYRKQTDYDKCMLLNVYSNNVKLLMER
jgi:hypothetical protein